MSAAWMALAFSLLTLKRLATLLWLAEPTLRSIRNPNSENFNNQYTWGAEVRRYSRLATSIGVPEELGRLCSGSEDDDFLHLRRRYLRGAIGGRGGGGPSGGRPRRRSSAGCCRARRSSTGGWASTSAPSAKRTSARCERPRRLSSAFSRAR